MSESQSAVNALFVTLSHTRDLFRFVYARPQTTVCSVAFVANITPRFSCVVHSHISGVIRAQICTDLVSILSKKRRIRS